MKHIKTASGFEADIDESAANNMEFVDVLAEMDAGTTPGAYGISRICNLILGKENKKALYDHLRDEKGHVPADKVEEELTEILKSLGDETKN